MAGKMTTYGTIPTTSTPGGRTNLGDISSRAKQRLYTTLSTRKPWKLMFNIRSFTIPHNFPDAVSRLRTNLAFFLTNYIIIFLLILFLSLLWHPISLIVFIIMMVAWLLLYFLRDQPLVVFNRTIDDRLVLGLLGVLTIVFLLLTHVTLNVIVSLLIGVAFVVLHGVFGRIDDLPFDEEEDAGAGFLASSSASP